METPARPRLLGFPWAALLAFVVVLWADRAWFDRSGRWEGLQEDLEQVPEPLVRVESGLVEDRLTMASLAQRGEGRHAILMGNSRARALVLPRRNPGLVIHRVTHAPISPVLMRSFADEAAAAAPDAFVVLLSEMDTHHPVHVVPRATYASFGALASTAATLGPGRVFQQRQEFERWVVANLFETYRHRDILARAGLDDWRRFDPGKGGRLPALGPDTEVPEVELPPIEGLEELLETLQPASKRRVSRVQFQRVSEIVMGAHARHNERLLEETFRKLRDAGSEVLIVEGPLDPQSYLLYDRDATRPEFLAFAERMVEELGCHFLPLEETGPYAPRDFLDVLHLTARGGTRLGRTLSDRLREILGLRAMRVPGGR